MAEVSIPEEWYGKPLQLASDEDAEIERLSALAKEMK